MAVFVPRLRNDARIMAAIGQRETYFRIGQHVDLMDRTPWGDMVGLCAHHEHRGFQRRQAGRLIARHKAPLGQIIPEKQFAQIFAVHGKGHPRTIGIPDHQVAGRGPLTHQIFVQDARPDQIVGTQHLERAAHLPAVEIAALPHHAVEQVQLRLINEEA